MGFVRAFGLVLLLSAGLSAGCNTAPTLPLPPPVASVAKPDMQCTCSTKLSSSE